MTAQLVMWLLMSQYSHLGTEEVGLADLKGLLHLINYTVP